MYIKILSLKVLIVILFINCSKSKKIIDKKFYNVILETEDFYVDKNGDIKSIKLAKSNGKIGFLKENGEELFPCIFDSVVIVNNYNTLNSENISTRRMFFTVSRDNNQYAKVKKDGKWGLISIEGKIIIPCIYDEIYEFDYSKTERMEPPYIDYLDWGTKIAIVKKNRKWGLVNDKGYILTECNYEEFFIPDVQLFYKNRAGARKNGKWGFLNLKGETVIPFIFDSIGSNYLNIPSITLTFSDRMAIVKKNGKWGVIDTNGIEIIPFIYDYISIFSNGLAAVKKNAKWGYINQYNEEVIPIIYDEVKWFELGVCPVKKDNLWGFINEKNQFVIPAIYSDILILSNYDGGLSFFSDDNYCAVKKGNKWGLIDKDNNIIVNFDYDEIKVTKEAINEIGSYLLNGFLAVRKGILWGVVNKKGENCIPFDYNDIEILSDRNICVKKGCKWGLVDSVGREIVPIKYESAFEVINRFYK